MAINVRFRPQIGTDAAGNPEYGPYMSMGCASVVQDTADATAPIRLLRPMIGVLVTDQSTVPVLLPEADPDTIGDITVAGVEVTVYQDPDEYTDDTSTTPRILVDTAGNAVNITRKANLPAGNNVIVYTEKVDPNDDTTYVLESRTVLDSVTGRVRSINAASMVRDTNLTVVLDSSEVEDEKELDKLRSGAMGLVEVQDTRTCAKWYQNSMIGSKSTIPTQAIVVPEGQEPEDTNSYSISLQLGELEFLPDLRSRTGAPRASLQVAGEGLSFDVGALPDDC